MQASVILSTNGFSTSVMAVLAAHCLEFELAFSMKACDLAY